MSQTRTTTSRTQESSRHPTSTTTREAFLDDRQRPAYQVSFRLTQTKSAAGQVEIHELVEFAEDLRWVIQNDYQVPIDYWNVDDHDISITLGDLPLGTIADREFEAALESVADNHDIGLCKTVSLSQPSTHSDGTVFVKYTYGWGENDTEYWTSHPDNPQARVDWVGGYRGRPETLEECNIRITNVESTTITHPRLSRLRRWLASLV